MGKQQLYVVHGMGSDAVGLVGRITAPIAQAKGNIVDLRQDVLHGLFTVYMVVDLAESSLDLETLQTVIGEIAEDTGLRITVDRFSPVPRSRDKKNLLMILVGMDKPGIIAASSELLGKYNANIEFVQTIGREGVFLMELLTDVSHVSIPVENLKRAISKNLEALSIKTTFQDDHVFNKRKRIILFNIASSFIDRPTLGEIMEQTGLSVEDVRAAYSGKALLPMLEGAVAKLDGLPIDVIDTVLECIAPTAGSMELIQTLKVMGYKIVLVSNGLSFVTDHIGRRLDLDYAYGIRHQVDDDARTIGGELVTEEPGSHDIDTVLSQLTELENVDRQDITIITDEGCAETPGIRLDFNLEILLDCFNQHVTSKENMIGLLGSFGAPDLG